jgi:hypothetical protein
MIKSMPGEVVQQLAEGFRSVKDVAGNEPVNLLQILVPVGHKARMETAVTDVTTK